MCKAGATHWVLITCNMALATWYVVSGQKRTASTSWTEQHKSQSFDWQLDTVNSSATSTDWKFPIQMNVHAARVLKSQPHPAPSFMLWDTRHDAGQWMPTESFGEQLRHCGREQTSPYSPDWRSSMARNTEGVCGTKDDGIWCHIFLWWVALPQSCWGILCCITFIHPVSLLSYHNLLCVLLPQHMSLPNNEPASPLSFSFFKLLSEALNQPSSSSSSAFPSYISGVHHFWVRFLRMWPLSCPFACQT